MESSSQIQCLSKPRWFETGFIRGVVVFGELLGVVMIGFALYVYIEEHDDRGQEAVSRAWTILTTPAPGNSGKKEALEFLAKKTPYLQAIDLSCERMGGGWNSKAYYCARPTYLADTLFGHDVADFSRANFSGVDFSRSNFVGSGFISTDFRGANFSYVRIEGGAFDNANFSGASFFKAKIARLSAFEGANFSNADLTEAIFGDLPKDLALTINFNGAWVASPLDLSDSLSYDFILDVIEICSYPGSGLLLNHPDTKPQTGCRPFSSKDRWILKWR